MKAYVLSNSSDIQFGAQPTPQSRYATREHAQADCRDLNQVNIEVGTHRCSFSVDALPEGDFGIICVCHPLHSGLA